MDVSEVLLSATGALVVGSVGYLIRYFMEQDRDRELQRIGNELQRISKREEILFQSLHPQRVERLIKVFHNLRESAHRLSIFQHAVVSLHDLPKRDKAYDDYLDHLTTTIGDFTGYKFYFGRTTIALIDRVYKEIQETERALDYARDLGPSHVQGPENKEIREQRKASIAKSFDRYKKELREALAALEDDIRKMLGVDD